MNHIDRTNDDQSRRTFLKTAAYAAPLILSLKAEPAFASYGSGNDVKGNNGVRGNNGVGGSKGPKGNNGLGNGWDPQPPGNPPVNDEFGSGPGNPGHHGGRH